MGRCWVLTAAMLAVGGTGCGPDQSHDEARSTTLDAAASTAWLRHVRSAGMDRGVATADRAGHVFLAAVYEGRHADFGGGPIESDASGPHFAFVKYDGDGTPLWTRTFAGAPGATTSGGVSDIRTDVDGNLLVIGYAGSRGVDFGGGAVGAGFAYFLAKFSADGSHVWSQTIDAPFRWRPQVSADRAGHLVVGPLGPLSASDTGFRIYRADGTLIDEWRAKGHLYTFAVDRRGRVVVAGATSDYVPLDPSGPPHPLLARYTQEGRQLWAKVLDGARGTIVALDVRNHTVVGIGGFTGAFMWAGQRIESGTIGRIGLSLMVVADGRGREHWARTVVGGRPLVEHNGDIVVGRAIDPSYRPPVGVPQPDVTLEEYAGSDGADLGALVYPGLTTASRRRAGSYTVINELSSLARLPGNDLLVGGNLGQVTDFAGNLLTPTPFDMPLEEGPSEDMFVLRLAR